ncbi:hypothetical protein PYH56_12425 (plasmid) [Staphylococcus epidermidis]|uniref:hypothetical protein n=1 Tax=Staphylococcus epidermidis TaxID=1282 RepID=UPI0024ACC348|nr:hypothetical protein [Staphylococcus epidermidis]WHI82627.1 hypothetical protein PYH56_12425 [Staphylococcus epidermidis]
MQNKISTNILVGLIINLLFYVFIEGFKWLYGVEKITLEISGQILSVILLITVFLVLMFAYFHYVHNKS